MANTSKRLYTCGECSHTQMLYPWIFNRSTRPRCDHCGSVRLELSAEAISACAETRAALKNYAVTRRGHVAVVNHVRPRRFH